MPFARKYSDEQIRLVVEAQVSRGLSSRVATEAAAAGTLPGQKEPFAMTASAARHYAGIRRRDLGANVVALSERGARVVAVATDRLTRRLERETAMLTRDSKPIDMRRFRELCRATTELARLVRLAQVAPVGQPARGTDIEAGVDRDFIAELAKLVDDDGAQVHGGS